LPVNSSKRGVKGPQKTGKAMGGGIVVLKRRSGRSKGLFRTVHASQNCGQATKGVQKEI